MKRRYPSFLWSIPFLIFLVCTLLVIVIQHVVGDTLRTVPEIGLTWFGVVSIEMLILWGRRTLQAFRYGRESTSLRVVKVVTIILSIAVSCSLIGAAIFVSGYAYTPEHVVVRNDIKMVARVSSFLDEQVDYYQYKNAFFYGKNLGYEYYGSGGGDPLADTDGRVPKRWTLYDLDGNTITVGGISEETTTNNIETEDTVSLPQEP